MSDVKDKTPSVPTTTAAKTVESKTTTPTEAETKLSQQVSEQKNRLDEQGVLLATLQKDLAKSSTTTTVRTMNTAVSLPILLPLSATSPDQLVNKLPFQYASYENLLDQYTRNKSRREPFDSPEGLWDLFQRIIDDLVFYIAERKKATKNQWTVAGDESFKLAVTLASTVYKTALQISKVGPYPVNWRDIALSADLTDTTDDVRTALTENLLNPFISEYRGQQQPPQTFTLYGPPGSGKTYQTSSTVAGFGEKLSAACAPPANDEKGLNLMSVSLAGYRSKSVKVLVDDLTKFMRAAQADSDLRRVGRGYAKEDNRGLVRTILVLDRFDDLFLTKEESEQLHKQGITSDILPTLSTSEEKKVDIVFGTEQSTALPTVAATQIQPPTGAVLTPPKIEELTNDTKELTKKVADQQKQIDQLLASIPAASSSAPSASSSAPAATALGGGAGRIPKFGGDGEKTTKRSAELVDELVAFFSNTNLHKYPDVWVIMNARYMWKIPAALNLKQRSQFVDLPKDAFRLNWIKKRHTDAVLFDLLQLWMKHKIIQDTKTTPKDIKGEGSLEHLRKAQAVAGSTDQMEHDTWEFLNTTKRKIIEREGQMTVDRAMQSFVKLLRSDSTTLAAAPQAKSAREYIDAKTTGRKELFQKIMTYSGMSQNAQCGLENQIDARVLKDLFVKNSGRAASPDANAFDYGFTVEELNEFLKEISAQASQRTIREFLKQSYWAGHPDVSSTCPEGSNYSDAQGNPQPCARIEEKLLPPRVFYSMAEWKQEDFDNAKAKFASKVTLKPDYPKFVKYELYDDAYFQLATNINTKSLECRGDKTQYLFPPKTGGYRPSSRSKPVPCVNPLVSIRSIIAKEQKRIAGRQQREAEREEQRKQGGRVGMIVKLSAGKEIRVPQSTLQKLHRDNQALALKQERTTSIRAAGAKQCSPRSRDDDGSHSRATRHRHSSSSSKSAKTARGSRRERD